MAVDKITCKHCGAKTLKEIAAINRANKAGSLLFCNRKCAGLYHRNNKTQDQKREEKRIYDQKYRKKNAALIRQKKQAYFQETYDAEHARIVRSATKKKKPELEEKRRQYMRSKEYCAAKKRYDQEYRAKKQYGEYWESGILAIEINNEVKSRSSDIEIRTENGTLNKCLQRKRQYESSISYKLKGIPLGDLERNKR